MYDFTIAKDLKLQLSFQEGREVPWLEIAEAMNLSLSTIMKLTSGDQSNPQLETATAFADFWERRLGHDRNGVPITLDYFRKPKKGSPVENDMPGNLAAQYAW